MSVTPEEVKKLAELSRLALSEEEITRLQGEISAILEYIGTIQKVELHGTPADSPYLELENVLREDGDPHETGIFTEALLAQAPRRDGSFLKVKKILS